MTPRIENLKAHVQALAAIVPPRNPLNPASLDQAGDYIARQFALAGLSPVTQEITAEGRSYRNILVSYGPQTGPRLVIGAHYDVCGDTPGADDDASGIAGLLELARWFGEEKPDLPYGVELAAYTLEEPPFFATENMGSYHHARRLSEGGVEVRLMLNLEMIGYFSDQPGSQEVPHGQEGLYPTTGNFLLVVGAGADPALTGRIHDRLVKLCTLPVQSIHFPYTDGLAGMSDQRNFWRFGFPAVMISDSNFYRNPHYHKPSDTPETLDYVRMAQVVEGVAKLIAEGC